MNNTDSSLERRNETKDIQASLQPDSARDEDNTEESSTMQGPSKGSIEFANKLLWNYSSQQTLPRPSSRMNRLHSRLNEITNNASKKKQNNNSYRVLPQTFAFKKCEEVKQTYSNPPFLPYVSPPNSPLSRKYNIAPQGRNEYDYHCTFYDEGAQSLSKKTFLRIKSSLVLVKQFCTYMFRTLWAMNCRTKYLLLSMMLVVLVSVNFPQKSIIRERVIAYQIIEREISDFEALKFPTSPQFQALRWIAHEDPLILRQSDDNLYIRYGLAVFYYSVDTYFRGSINNDWDNNTWLTGASVCQWHGVLCDNLDSDHSIPLDIVGLNLTNIKGHLPQEVSVLTPLKWIHLGNGNEISGTIPSKLGLLTNLMVLSLENNNLSGSIPSEITNIRSLELLGLQNNSLDSTIPKDIGHLSNLAALYLDRNKLSGQIPTSIGTLRKTLVDLRLNYNELAGSIPPDIGNLVQLQKLHLEANQLSSTIPYQLSNLSRLHYLDLRENNLRGQLPENVCHSKLLICVDSEKLICSCCECLKDRDYEGM